MLAVLRDDVEATVVDGCRQVDKRAKYTAVLAFRCEIAGYNVRVLVR